MKREKECPMCALMNPENADTCKHCGTAFFFELECLDPKLDNPADELIVVGRYGSILDAHMVRGFLEEHGIAACVPEEFAPRILGFEAPTVRVRRKDVELARRLIAGSGIS